MSKIAFLAVFISLALGPVAAVEPTTAQSSGKPIDAGQPWPIQFSFSAELTDTWTGRARKQIDRQRGKNNNEAHVWAWTPPEATTIKAVMLVPNNTDLVHIAADKFIRKIASKHSMAIVYLKTFPATLFEAVTPVAETEAHLNYILQNTAALSGHQSIIDAPWVTFGKSSRGRFSFRLSWLYPERIIASVCYHGETPTWPMASWAVPSDESIMHAAINGVTEWDGTWYRAVRPSLLNYHRHTNWLTHQVVLYGIDHGDYFDYYKLNAQPIKFPKTMISSHRVWKYIGIFLDEALKIRLPATDDPDTGPVKLNTIDRSSGYLIHPRAPEHLLGLKWFALRQKENGDYATIPWPQEQTPVYDDDQGLILRNQLIVPAANVSHEEQANYLWLPNETMVKAWLRLHNLYGLKEQVLPQQTPAEMP